MSFSTPAPGYQAAIFSLYETFKEQSLEHPRFRHRDLAPLLAQVALLPGFEVTVAGRSVEERELYLIRVGTGPKKVLLWSQMHGNEPTATLALLDFFHFLQATDELDGVRQQLLSELTLYVLPMLNPDGVERFQRNNALDIDLNRDARRLTSPEAQLLHELVTDHQPEFGFNLHDMDYRHSVGHSGLPATISFLAPPADEAKTETPSRRKAIRLISYLHQILEGYIPGRMGRWPDTFEPRAFGDTIQALGTSVILLEAGGYPNDPDKHYARHLIFLLLVSGLHAIASDAYAQQPEGVYHRIPENGPLLFDLIVRQVQVKRGYGTYTMDLGLMYEEIILPGSPERTVRGEIAERGDLSVPHAYAYLEADGLVMQPGKIYPNIFADPVAAAAADHLALLREGYLYLQVKQMDPVVETLPLPVNVLVGDWEDLPAFETEKAATFVLERHGQPVYALVNGFVHDLRLERLRGRYNGLVYFK